MFKFDDRIVSVVLTYGETRLTISDAMCAISAYGMKYADPTQNECTVTIANLRKETRDQLATQLTPNSYNDQRKSIELYAGRVSTGLSLLYKGDIVLATPSQPPDITLCIVSKTAQFFKYDIVAQSYAQLAPASTIAKGIADSMGLKLQFEAQDKQIANWSYTGPTTKQADRFGAVGNMDAYIDDDTFVVKNKGEPLKNVSFVLSQDSGMVGQPEPTEYGVRVKCLFNPSIRLGGGLNLESALNPAVSGDGYTIVKSGFQIATRDVPFYSMFEATRYPDLYFNPVPTVLGQK